MRGGGTISVSKANPRSRNLIQISRHCYNDNKTLSPSAAPALPTNTKPVGKQRSNTLPSGSASIPTTQTTTNEPTNQTNKKNLKGDSGAVALAFNVPRSVARTALNEEKGNEMNAARRVMHESMSAEVKCAVCCDFFYNACTLTCWPLFPSIT